MGVDLTKSIISGKGARFPGLEIESHGEVGVRISYNRKFAIVPWANIIVALGEEEVPK